MKEVSQFVSITEAKNKLLSIIRNLVDKDEVLAITKDGIPAAVVLSPERYEGLLETIEILSDSKMMRALSLSVKQARNGKWVGHEDVFGKEGA